jgi:hypothetical protein
VLPSALLLTRAVGAVGADLAATLVVGSTVGFATGLALGGATERAGARDDLGALAFAFVGFGAAALRAGGRFAATFLAADFFADVLAAVFEAGRAAFLGVDLEDFLRVFLDIRLPFVAFDRSIII